MNFQKGFYYSTEQIDKEQNTLKKRVLAAPIN